MTKDELLLRLQDIEWEDFEVKESKNDLPKNIWETVSAFANTSGGWIVLGIVQNGNKFVIEGVLNAEKVESDFLNTVRGCQKLNHPLMLESKKFLIENKVVLAFKIFSSPLKPIWFNSIANTFIRSGSGDRRATEMEINAMFRDQAFGSKSEEAASGTSFSDLNLGSYDTYRRHIRFYNPNYPYVNANDETFCRKTGIFAKNSNELSIGGLLMLGKLDSIHNHLPNFWIDYIEIPGTSYTDASLRYTFRMQEQENIWEYYQVILQRLRLYTDNPFVETIDGASPDDESQLYALKEGLVNFLAHSDYFSPMHPTIRIYTDRIEFQNPGDFHIPLERLMNETVSQPRNPSVMKLFRAAKLGENAGYGIDKIKKWKELTGNDVLFKSEITFSSVVYYRVLSELSDNQSNIQNVTSTKTSTKTSDGNMQDRIIKTIKSSPDITIEKLAQTCGISRGGVRYHLDQLKKEGRLQRIGKKGGYWKIRNRQ